jgi:TM2 domain-containing membrane protein YozV
MERAARCRISTPEVAMSRTFRIFLAVVVALIAAFTMADAQSPTTTAATQQSASNVKDPTTARFIGTIPGAGHMYAGETGRGLAYMGGVVGLAVVGGALVFQDCFNFTNDPCDTPALPYVWVGATLGLWGWSIYDAGRAAQRTNAKHASRIVTFVAPAMLSATHGRSVPGLRLGLTIATR